MTKSALPIKLGNRLTVRREEKSKLNYEKCLRCGNRMLGNQSKGIPKGIRLPTGITISV
jgi:hypothetical protein